jgi:hypothetical protein
VVIEIVMGRVSALSKSACGISERVSGTLLE